MVWFIGNHQVNLDAGQRRNAERIQETGIGDKIGRLNMNRFLGGRNHFDITILDVFIPGIRTAGHNLNPDIAWRIDLGEQIRFIKNIVMVLPPFILLGLHLVLGRMMQRPLEKLRLRIAKSSGSILSWVLCIAGLILLLNSIDNL